MSNSNMNPQVYEVKVFSNGTKHWYQNDKLHRLDGPAIECSNGAKHWLQNGQHHRLDGPAFECPDGAKRWYIEGEEFSEKEFLAKTAPKMEPPSCEGKIVEIDGRKYKLTII